MGKEVMIRTGKTDRSGRQCADSASKPQGPWFRSQCNKKQLHPLGCSTWEPSKSGWSFADFC